MKRRLFNLLAAVSLVLCLSMGILWIRSYFAQDSLNLIFADNSANRAVAIGLGSNRGCLTIGRAVLTSTIKSLKYPYNKTRLSCETSAPTLVNTSRMGFWQMLGFDRHTGSMGGTYSMISATLTLPHWVFVITVLVPLCCVWFRRLRRTRRVSLSLCAECGYDLRASKDRCPECGTAIPAASASELLRGEGWSS